MSTYAAVPQSSSLLPVEHEADVLQAIRDTRFGTVEIVVHQSRIVQITRSEKFRFEKANPDPR